MAVGTGKNDPAGPRRDSSGRNASSASSPSRGGYNGARSGGNIPSNGLGIRTGSTIRGNTAFAPAGGMAQGYATNSRLGSGMGPSVGAFSNFRNLDGSAMIGGGLQNRAIAARNPQQALGMLRALQGYQRPSAGRVGGLLDGEQVTVGPTTIEPAAAPMTPTITGPWPGQAINPFVRQMGVKRQDRIPPTITGPWPGQGQNRQVNVLGGGGMPGTGFVPNASRWSEDAKSYYGGYSRPSTWDSFRNSIGGWMGNGMTYRGGK